MNNQEKKDVLSLREEGLTYAEISKKLGISANTVKSFCRREKEKEKLCRSCGAYLPQGGGRKKRFCCDTCRQIWWKEHRDQIERKRIYRFHCRSCGRDFESYGHKNRKYCSHRCYIDDRFGGKPEGVP